MGRQLQSNKILSYICACRGLVDSIHCEKGFQQPRIHTHTLKSLPTHPVNNETYLDMSPRSSLGSPSLYNASKNIDLQDDQPHLGTGQ